MLNSLRKKISSQYRPVEFLVVKKSSPGTVLLVPEAITLLGANVILQTDSSLLLNPPIAKMVLCHQTAHSSHQKDTPASPRSQVKIYRNSPPPETHGLKYFSIHKASLMEHQKNQQDFWTFFCYCLLREVK